MKRAGYLLALLVLGGCAERDNPFDPIHFANRKPEPAPVPGPSSLVVDPDSACRNCPYFGNLGSALSTVQAGDTIWIRGGTYKVTDIANVARSGTFTNPIMIRSYRGEARFVAQAGVQACLRIDQPFIHIRGIACVGSEGSGLILNGAKGPITVDSSRFDSCKISGISIQDVTGPVRLQDIRLSHNGKLGLEVIGPVRLDTLRIVTTER